MANREIVPYPKVGEPLSPEQWKRAIIERQLCSWLLAKHYGTGKCEVSFDELFSPRADLCIDGEAEVADHVRMVRFFLAPWGRS